MMQKVSEGVMLLALVALIVATAATVFGVEVQHLVQHIGDALDAAAIGR